MWLSMQVIINTKKVQKPKPTGRVTFLHANIYVKQVKRLLLTPLSGSEYYLYI